MSDVKNAGEKGVEPLHAESFAAAFGLMKFAGITATTIRVGGPMLANTTMEMGTNAGALAKSIPGFIRVNAEAIVLINTMVDVGVGAAPGTPSNHNQNIGFTINEIFQRFIKGK